MYAGQAPDRKMPPTTTVVQALEDLAVDSRPPEDINITSKVRHRLDRVWRPGPRTWPGGFVPVSHNLITYIYIYIYIFTYVYIYI